MRDLYQRLALAPDVDAPTLEAAIEACHNRALRQDAEATLVVASHRQRYDETHRVLRDIGSLRARLGLTHAPHWQGEAANDFSQPSSGPASSLDTLTSRVSEAVSLFDRFKRLGGGWLLVALFVLGACVGLVGGLALAAGLGVL
ncbi:hypothetical protein [Halomonas sp. 707D7]|uniref:hypothetical protein n=1 Tax=Halomonas sp. 707D7 TaxID=1681044 RepID=UPI00209E8D3C|nr:hypothetical protein [Halomonas sp. 707D7]MCP1316147.1 hypothetical protein [Halomonas sp. 707D7]